MLNRPVSNVRPTASEMMCFSFSVILYWFLLEQDSLGTVLRKQTFSTTRFLSFVGYCWTPEGQCFRLNSTRIKLSIFLRRIKNASQTSNRGIWIKSQMEWWIYGCGSPEQLHKVVLKTISFIAIYRPAKSWHHDSPDVKLKKCQLGCI